MSLLGDINKIRIAQEKTADALQQLASAVPFFAGLDVSGLVDLINLVDTIKTLASDVHTIAEESKLIAASLKSLAHDEVTGIAVVPDAPTTHAVPHSVEGAISMAKFKVKLMKKAAVKALSAETYHKATGKPGAAPAPALDFVLADNGDDTCTVWGLSAAGNRVDISSLASLSVTSDTPATLTVDVPVDMTFAMHAVGPLGAVKVSIVATWGDGSVGPFSIDLPVNVVAGPTNSLLVEPGVPTAH